MRIIITVFLLSLLVGLSFAQGETGWNIVKGLCDLYSLVNTAGIFILGSLILISAGLYAGGQFFGAEYRSKAVVYATGIAVGAVIGILIYFTLPIFIEMISGENIKEACGWVETEGYLLIGGREVGSLTLDGFLTNPHAYGVEIDGIALFNILNSPEFQSCLGGKSPDQVTMNEVNALCNGDDEKCRKLCNTILATFSIYADWTGEEDIEIIIGESPECASGLKYCRCWEEIGVEQCLPDDGTFADECSGSCSGDYTWSETRCACVDEYECKEDEFYSVCKNGCVDEDKCTKKGLEWNEGICDCINAGQQECEEKGDEWHWATCDGDFCTYCPPDYPIWDNDEFCDCIDAHTCRMQLDQIYDPALEGKVDPPCTGGGTCALDSDCLSGQICVDYQCISEGECPDGFSFNGINNICECDKDGAYLLLQEGSDTFLSFGTGSMSISPDEWAQMQEEAASEGSSISLMCADESCTQIQPGIVSTPIGTLIGKCWEEGSTVRSLYYFCDGDTFNFLEPSVGGNYGYPAVLGNGINSFKCNNGIPYGCFNSDEQNTDINQWTKGYITLYPKEGEEGSEYPIEFVEYCVDEFTVREYDCSPEHVDLGDYSAPLHAHCSDGHWVCDSGYVKTLGGSRGYHCE